MNKFTSISILISSLFLCSGCDELDELLNTTSTMYAEFEVVSDPEYTVSTVYAKVKSKNSTGDLITLDSSDSFWATGNGERKKLGLYATIIGSPTPNYRAEFGSNTANTVFSISLDREGNTDAPNSTATLPDPFIIDIPVDDSTLSRNNDITYMWTPGQSNWTMEIKTIIYCIRGVGEETISEETTFEFEDSVGVAVLSPEEHSPSAVRDYTGDCSFRVIFSRINPGTIDKNFNGGYFNAIQRRDIYITTTGY